MLLQAVCIISQPLVNSNCSCSPETPNLGQNRRDLEIWQMTKFGGSSLKAWWFMARTSSGLTDTHTDRHTDRQTDAGNDNTRRPKLASGKKVWRRTETDGDGRTDGDGQENTINKAAWSQLKSNKAIHLQWYLLGYCSSSWPPTSPCSLVPVGPEGVPRRHVSSTPWPASTRLHTWTSPNLAHTDRSTSAIHDDIIIITWKHWPFVRGIH